MKNFHEVYYNHYIQFQVFFVVNLDFHNFFLKYDKLKDKNIDIDEVKNSKF